MLGTEGTIVQVHDSPGMTKILMVASEARPFAKTGGLADVIGSLPDALRAIGENVAGLMPRYRGVALEGRRIFDHLPISLGDVSYSTLVSQIAQSLPLSFFYFPQPSHPQAPY